MDESLLMKARKTNMAINHIKDAIREGGIKMLNAIKQHIEKRHNVTLDDIGALYTTGDAHDNYGWQPVPKDWIQDAAIKVWADWTGK